MTAQPSESRPMVETRALRMLRAGDDIKTVSTATGLTREELQKLQRDFPGPTPVTASTRTCDFAACTAPATAKADDWAFCASHAKADAAQREQELATVAQAVSPIGRLLEDASGHTVARVRALAARIETQLDQLRSLIAEHAEAEQSRRAAIAAKAAARARVKELEEQLRAAKAALKDGKTPRPPAAADGTFACTKGCGRTFVNSQGRGKHERSCGAAS